MIIDRIPTVLRLVAILLVLAAPGAQANWFKPKPVSKSPKTVLKRQAAPKINKRLENVVTTENSTLVVSLSQQRAFLKVRGTDDVYIDTPISSGTTRHRTPTGTFTVLQKNPDHRSSIYGDFVDSRGRVVRSGISTKIHSAPSGTRYVGAPMKWFCRLTWTGIGMHVGILPGYPASHGCIRLPAEIAPLIYQKVKLGTPVSIIQ